MWVEFGDELAVTLGDWLINQAYDVILQVEAPAHTTRALARAMAKAVAETVRGQAVENEAKTCLDTNLTDYIDMATGKTAPLLAFPLVQIPLLAAARPRLVTRRRCNWQLRPTALCDGPHPLCARDLVAPVK